MDGEPIGREEFAEMFSDPDKRRVALDTRDDITVSTVLLGLDHFWGEGPPLIFETMNDHGGWHTVVGWGKTKTQAREDADQQVAHLLEAGWEVASVSSPDSIFRDLCRYPTADRRAA